MSKYNTLWNYVKQNCTDTLKLTFNEIENILGFSIDHSFLNYKKELEAYGLEVEKISMKEKTVLFVKTVCKPLLKESKKDFNAMLNNSKDMPKIQIIEDEKTIKKYGGNKMFFAPPLFYNELMKNVPKGKLVTVGQLRNYLAQQNNADFTDPMTAGIFVNIVAWASYQRKNDITPYWRTLKSDGELNAKYPEAIKLQKKLLEQEGHTIILKGTKNIKYYVKNFENNLIKL